jgi:hypothetical protein
MEKALVNFFSELTELGKQPQCQGIGEWTGSPTRQLERLAAEDKLDGLITFMLNSKDNELPLDGAQVRLYHRMRRNPQGESKLELSIGGIDRHRYPREFYQLASALIKRYGFQRD